MALVDIARWQRPVPAFVALGAAPLLLSVQYGLLALGDDRPGFWRMLRRAIQILTVLFPLLYCSESSPLCQGLGTVLCFYFNLRLLDVLTSLRPSKGAADDGWDRPTTFVAFWQRILQTHPTRTTVHVSPYLAQRAEDLRTLVQGQSFYCVRAGRVVTLAAPEPSKLRRHLVTCQSVATWYHDPVGWFAQRQQLRGLWYFGMHALVYCLGVCLLLWSPLSPLILDDDAANQRKFAPMVFPALGSWPVLLSNAVLGFFFFWGMNSAYYFYYGSASWLLGFPLPSLFDWPYLATSLHSFWSRRWNILFKDTFHQAIFRPTLRALNQRHPAHRTRNLALASLAVFGVSALMHEHMLLGVNQRTSGHALLFFVLHGVLTCAEVALDHLARALWTAVSPRAGRNYSHVMQTMPVQFVGFVVNNLVLSWTAPLFINSYILGGFHWLLVPYLPWLPFVIHGPRWL
ncbi:hypothetical protein H4R34_000788 [Dimargaris verticillata]|uniref:Wax synthase domain-containing protein n=1 Tax=Dimargaris verticillata TaxID=2761393 RepID=A0A9W8BBZ2_9FUNG|nr:hypothetical protein H4R34_000788 [Dimargaris verticillata]